jgi:2'-5' RNA ligase
MKNWVKLFEEFIALNEKAGEFPYGCVMLFLEVPGMDALQDKINPEDLSGSGLEKEHHVTLLYGLHDGGDLNPELDKEQIDRLIEISLKSAIDTRLYEVSAFKNADIEVLKFKADNEMLHLVNGELTKEFDFTTDYPEYNPHATIAYLKPGKADLYINEFRNVELVGKPVAIVYSRPNGKKVEYQVYEPK